MAASKVAKMVVMKAAKKAAVKADDSVDS
jgi:hypothetical protein